MIYYLSSKALTTLWISFVQFLNMCIVETQYQAGSHPPHQILGSLSIWTCICVFICDRYSSRKNIPIKDQNRHQNTSQNKQKAQPD